MSFSVQKILLKADQHIKNKEFKNSKSLIIGGSRGLGLATSKILIFGGANVYITYRKKLFMITIEHSHNPDSEWNKRLIDSNLGTIYQTVERANFLKTIDVHPYFLKFIDEIL